MTEYRFLEGGELIQAGDEADASRTIYDDAKWLPVAEHSIGTPVSDPKHPAHTIYRRAVCDWTLDNPEHDVWATSCDELFIIIDGSPTDNKMKFCPYCGKSIKETAVPAQGAA